MEELEYKLKFALNSRTLEITDIQEYDMDPLFDRKHQATEKICQFLHTLSTPVDVPLLTPIINKSRTEHVLYYCEVAIGKSIFSNEEFARKYSPPKDFDCFITANGVFDDKKTGILEFSEIERSEVGSKSSMARDSTSNIESSEISELRPDDLLLLSNLTLSNLENLVDPFYIIKDASAVKCIYKVSFTLDYSLEYMDDKMCHSCGISPAVCFCFAEKAQLCGECDNAIHSTELLRRHQKINFLDDAIKFVECEKHRKIIDFYCMKCCKPVCIYCNEKHLELISYEEAWMLKADFLDQKNFTHNGFEEFKERLVEYETENERLKAGLQYEFNMVIKRINLAVSRQSKMIIKDYLINLNKKLEIERLNSFKPTNLLLSYTEMKRQRDELDMKMHAFKADIIRVTGGYKINEVLYENREGRRPQRMSSDYFIDSIE